MKRPLIRSAVAWMSCWCLASGLLLGDVPLGDILWLQGYDGNPPQPGFQVDGILRLESIDEPLDVGLNISLGRVTNSVTGVIEVNPGAGGGRYVIGPVLNFGEMDVKGVNLSWFGNGQCENHGIINVSGFAGFGFYGSGTMLDLEAGSLVKADSTGTYVWVQNGKFVFNGGSVDFPVYVASGSAKLGDTATNAITLNFVGPGCRYDGALTSQRTVHLTYNGGFASPALTLANAPQLDGAIRIDTQPSGSPTSLVLAPGGLLISAKGSLTTAAGGVGVTITGNLTNAGIISQSGPLWLTGDQPVVNRGVWTVASAAPLTLATPLIQTAGTFALNGGMLTNTAGITLAGGTFMGSGTIDGSLSNRVAATLFRNRPLEVTGDWTQDAAASLEIRVSAGDPSTNAAALKVDGRLNLAGPLRVTTNGPVAWSSGQAIGIASVTNLSFLSGWFDNVQLPTLPAGLHWTMPASTNLFEFVVSTNAPALELIGQRGTADHSYSLNVFGPLGTDLVVEQSNDFSNWQAATNQARFEGFTRFNLPITTAPRQWFRARFTPASGN